MAIDPFSGLDDTDPRYYELYGIPNPNAPPAPAGAPAPVVTRERQDPDPYAGNGTYGNDQIVTELDENGNVIYQGPPRNETTGGGKGGDNEPPSPILEQPPEREIEKRHTWDSLDITGWDPNERDSVNSIWNQIRGMRDTGRISSNQYGWLEDDYLKPGWASSERDYQHDLGDFRTRQHVMEALGANFGEYEDDFNAMLQKYRMDSPSSLETGKVYSDYYGNGATSGNFIVNALNGRYRNNNVQGANQFFSPQRPYQDLSDTYDDSLIDTLIGESRPVAEQQLGYAQKRGTLNGRGMAAAQQRLGKKETEVRAGLQGKGSTLLEAIRGKLGTIGTEARTNAAGTTIGDNFSLNPYKDRYAQTFADGTRDFEGNLRSQMTGDEFAIKDIIGGASTQQGINNGKGSDLLGALEENKRRKSGQRGLGSQGAF